MNQSSLEPGQAVGDYKVVSMIGKGAAAAVYEVEDADGASRALKILHVESVEYRTRFEREASIQSKLPHPNIVQVYDTIDLDGKMGLVMERVLGPTLQEWLSRYQPNAEEAEAVFTSLVGGMNAAHRHGRAHRDLKPANVMLSAYKQGIIPKVGDFGCVKLNAETEEEFGEAPLTRAGSMVGSLSYMAPEQVEDARDVDQRTDLWALGCILYELLTCKRAFVGKNPIKVMMAVLEADYAPLPDTVPEHLRSLVTDLLQPNPDKRVQSCLEVIARLGRNSDGKPVPLSEEGMLALFGEYTPPEDKLSETAAGEWETLHGFGETNVQTLAKVLPSHEETVILPADALEQVPAPTSEVVREVGYPVAMIVMLVLLPVLVVAGLVLAGLLMGILAGTLL